MANLNTGVILNSNLQSIDASQNNPNFFHYYWAVDVDPATDTLYWTMAGPDAAANNQILKATYTTGATPTLGAVTALYTATSAGPLPEAMAIDVANGVYYVALSSSVNFNGTIVEGSLSTANGTQTTIYTLPSNTQPQAILFEGAPVLTAGATVGYTEQGTAATLNSTLTVADSDGAVAGATVSITTGRVTGDTLNFTNQNGITGSYNSGSGVLTLTGSASVANYQAALRSITFSSASDNPTSFGASTSRTISWTSNDGILNSTLVTSTVNVTAVDDAPVVTAGTTVSYTEQGTATTLASTLTVSDVDNTNLAGATVSISAGFLAGDALNFTNQNGITGSYNGSTGVLTLTGSTTVANYQTALRSITFSSTSDNPTSFGTDTSRTIGWTASDGTLSSTAATSTVNITAVNDAPVVTAGTTASFTEQGSAVALSSTLTVSDADNQNLASATVSIGGFVTGDTLNFTDQNGITGSYNGSTGVLTLTGSATVANYQTALRSITFSSTSDNPTNFGASTSRTISWRANDGTANSTATNSTVNITAVDDAPVVTAGVTVNYSALGAAVVLDSTLTATDADNRTLAGATVSISTNLVTGDALNFINQNGISGSYNSGTGVLTLTGSATVANYQTALRSITYSSTNADPTNGGSESTRTISWTVNDGALDSAAATSTVNVGAPVVVAGATASFTEQGTAVVLDAGLTLTDNDSTNQASATVSISSGFFAGDTLNFTDQNGITGSFDGSTGVLTLTGSSLVANYQAALRSITFSSASDNPTNFGTSTSRTITWTANDGTLDSTPATSTLNITAVDDAPVLAAGASVIYTEQGTATVLDSTLTLSDVDNQNLASAKVQITSGLFPGDTLNFTNQNGISGSYDGNTGILTLTGSSSVANYQTALRSITFSSASDNPTSFATDTSRTISWQVNDGTLDSNADTSTVTVTAVNDAPVVTAGTTVSFTEQGSAVALSSTLTVSDADNQNLASASVSISSGFFAGDTLNFTDQNGITGSYDSGTGGLTLTGSATVANYQTALRSITFSSASDNPTNFGTDTSRTISWTASDGALSSTAATSTLNITAVNDAPVVTAGAVVGYTEQGSAVALDSTLTVTDADNQTLASAKVQITSGLFAGDRLNFTNQNGITGSYDSGTGILTLTGSSSLANYQTALRSITFSSSSDNPTSFGTDTSRTISWTANDGTTNSTADTSTLNVTAVNDAPVVTAGTTVSFTEQGSAVLLSSSLTITDADNQNLASATVSISSGFFTGDTLNFTNQNGISGSYDSGTGILTLTGSSSVANYQTALSSITFSSARDNPTNFGTDTSRTISWIANDGTANSTTATSTVNITAVNDAPVVTAGATVGYTEQGTTVVLNSGLTLSDVDNTTLAGATVSIGGFFVGDTLNFTNQNGITGSYNNTTGILTLTGTASIADYQTALQSITFSSASDNPTSFGTDTSRTITWTANDGALNSTAATSTLNITAVNDAPVVTAGATVGYTEQGTAVVLNSVLTVSDADNTMLASATVSITSGRLAGDTLNFTNQNGISGSYDSSTGVLTLTGSSSLAHYQAALESITFSSTSANPTSFGADTSRTVTWTINDGALDSNAATSTVTITAVNDPPVVTAGATVGYTERGTAAVLDASLTLSDPDNTSLAGATVSITSGFFAGDTLNFTDQNGITGNYNSGTGVLTLTGSASVADYQTALRSITFSSTSDNPTSFGTDTSRTITWAASDGALNSNAATSTVNVTAVNDPPVVTAGGTVSFTEQGTAAVLDASLTLSDPDNTTLASATISITSGFFAGDTLNFTNQNGISGSYDGSTGILTLTGSASIANYQTALRSITFSSPSDNPTNFGADTSRTISWTANDGILNSTTATSTVAVTAVNDAPVVTAGTTVGYTEQGTAAVLDVSLTLSDPDNTSLAGATVSITSGFFAGDKLNFTNQNGISGSYDGSTGVLTLTGSASVANYQTALRSITFSSTSDNPTDFGADTSRTVVWTVNDGALTSNAATSTANITAVNDAPVVTAGTTVGYTEQGSAVVLDASLTLSDADNTTLASATVSIGGFFAGDTLNFTNQNGISGSYDGSTGILTLTGSASVANYQAALRSITFSSTSDNPTNFGADASRTISWTVNDGAANSNPASSTVNVTAVNDPPVVTAGTTVGYTEQGTAAVLDASLTLSDPDNTTLASATVSIGGFFVGDTLNFTNQNGISGSYDGSTGILTLTGSASVANYQAALRSITFSSTSDNPTDFGADTSRTISWRVSDGAANSNTASSTVNVTAFNDAPVLLAGAAVIYTGQGPAAVLDAGLTLSDADSTTLSSATVSITSGRLAGDTLTFTDQNGITGSYNSGTGVLSLTGSASVTDYQTALRSISFSTSGADITAGGSDRTRTLSWQATDNGGAASATATSDVTVNDPPVITPSGAPSTFTAGGAPVPIDAGLTVTDREASQLIGATVSITGNFLAGDTLAASTAGTNITAVYDNVTGVLTLSGADSIAHYQSVLDGMTYSSSAADPTSAGARLSRAVSLQVTDVSGPLQVDSNTAIVTLTVHSPPVVTAGATATFNVGGLAVPLDAALTLTDAQSSTINGATVSISAGFFAGDTLNFATQNGITGNYNGSTGVLTLSGTAPVADYQAALASITYSSSAADPSNGSTDPSRTVSWSATDGIASSRTATSTLVTNGPPPTVDTNSASASFIQQGAPVVLDSVVATNDVDGNTLLRATVSITGGFLAGDTLAANTAGTSITAIYNAATGILTLTGADTEGHYAQVLQNVTYSSNAVDPTAGGADRVRTISWQVDDGKSGNNLSNIGTSTLAAHVRPVVVAGETVTFGAGAPVLVDPGVTATNTDTNPIVTAKVQITDGLLSSDVLAFNNGTNSMSFGDGATISGTYNSATGTLTLSVASGAPSAADFQQATQSITFANASATPGSAAAMSVRTLSWTLGTADPRQTSQAATSKIDPPPPPPPTPPPPSGGTGPVVAAPPAGPPPGLAPPPPTAGSYSFVLPTGLGFSFAPPSFTSDSTPISDIFSIGPGGMPSFFAPAKFEFGGTFGADGSVMVADGHPFVFQVPRTAFAVAADDRGISLTAALVDGGALPSWLSFDPKTGGFSGNPPADAKGVYDIAVTIRDAQGHQATKVFRFTVGPSQAALDRAPAATGAVGVGVWAASFATIQRDPGTSGSGPLGLSIDGDHLDDAPLLGTAIDLGGADRPTASDTAPVGKPAFSAQMRAAGRQGLLNDRQALLNSLHNGLGG